MGRHTIPDFRKARVCACGDHGFAALTIATVAFFSPERIEDVAPYRWCLLQAAGGNMYAKTSQPGGKIVTMHRLLASGAEIDHRDGDGLNNRDGNLRACSHQQNLWNSPSRGGTSRFKGVYRTSRGNKWAADITVNGRTRYLGSFADEEDAAEAYDAAAAALHGEFARLNAHLAGDAE